MRFKSVAGWLAAGIVAGALFTGPAAHAATVSIYTDRPSWESAVGSFAEETFTDATLNPGLSFTSDAGSVGSGRFNDRLTPGGDTTTFSFAPSISAFGGNFDLTPGGEGTGIQFNLFLSGGGTQLVGTQVPNSYSGGFFGLVSDTSFSAIKLQAGTQDGVAETYNLDNMVYASSVPSTVPEPTSMALLGMGALPLLRRLRRRKSAAGSKTL